MSDILNTAIAHHRQGQLGEAIALYEQSLAQTPDPKVQHLLGMAYFASGEPVAAERYLGLAAASPHSTPRSDYFFGHGNALHALKRYAEAYAAFQNAVALDPANAALWFNLGNSARFADTPMATIAYQQALALGLTEAFTPLATHLLEVAEYAAYGDLLRQAYDVQPAPKTENILSELILLGAPQAVFTGEANAPILAALATFPKDYAAHRPGANRGLALLLAIAGHETDALACLNAARADDPDAAKILSLVKNYLGLSERYASGLSLLDLVRKAYPQSRPALNTALLFALATENNAKILELLQAIDPTAFTQTAAPNVLTEQAIQHLFDDLKTGKDAVDSYLFLSRILEGHGKIPDAFMIARTAQELAPANTAANLQLARMAHRLDLDIAEAELQKALERNPGSADLLNYLGNIKMRRGDMASALDYYARARTHIGPAEGEKYELQLLSTLYTGGISGQLAGDMHKAWGDALIARQKLHRIRYGALSHKPELRIGYLSADFRECSVAYFLLPLLEQHDRQKVEVHLYANLSKPDAVTKKFQRLGAWHDIANLSDGEAIELIRSHDIDILVDLLGQNQGLRPVIFARKAAPVQVTWLGYATTSGLATIDYRFTDALADPPGMTEPYHAETLYRLPHFLCYQPPASTPPLTPLPALNSSIEGGGFTFGCFNQAMKITDEVVAVWAAIMRRVANSRMIVKAAELGDPKTLTAFRDKFAAHGIAAERIQYYSHTKFKYDHLSVYNEVDLTLDPFPFNGTTTTFEALWMGVPLITLEGAVHAARVGGSILAALDLRELIATTVEDYIEKAVELAQDLPRLARYRADMRARLQASPLMDAKKFAVSVEAAYAEMWAKAVIAS